MNIKKMPGKNRTTIQVPASAITRPPKQADMSSPKPVQPDMRRNNQKKSPPMNPNSSGI